MATPDDGPVAGVGAGRKFWRRASRGTGGQARRVPPPPTPHAKARSCLPLLEPLAITRCSLDEWPKDASDDVGEWPNPSAPGASKADGGPSSARPGEGLQLDLSTLRSQGRKDQIAFFDKECSKVAEHVYLGGDAVAKNRDILRKNGITHVLNCVGFICPEYFKSDLIYRTLWLQDSPTEDITSIFYDVFDYFEDVREQGGRVFVHCCQGVSRSTSLVIAYLMWREGQSFDDAFQFVKAARGIANPNMGFACQLLQCQKRVHAIPLSPNSVLRMYRMAPHSQYAPLHLVPKMLNDPSPAALDSRGAFIVHVLSSIYVWVGMKCDPVMEKDAKAAAYQVVRYEKVQGPIKLVREGLEPQEFWDAFSSTPLNSDSNTKVIKEQIHSASKSNPGSRQVESYDSDFELVYKAITGGVVPAFSTSGAGDETHLPDRESSWSLLRHKFITRSLARVYLAAEASTSPPFLNPSSLLSDSTVSTNYSSDLPSLSPSTSSPPSLGYSPATSNLPYALVPPSRSSLSQSSNKEPLEPGLESVRSPSKTSSIAERRSGGFLPLKLPSVQKDLVWPPRVPSSIRRTEEVTDKSTTNGVKQMTGESCSEICSDNISISQAETRLVERTGSNSEACSNDQLLVHHWPSTEKLTTFESMDLDPKSILTFVAPNASRREAVNMVCVWIGDEYESSSGGDTIDWQQVADDFLRPKGLNNALPVKIEKPHSTFHEDVNAWIATTKQHQEGLHHICVQQAGPKLHGRNNIKQMIMENILFDRKAVSNYTVICINAGSGHGKTSLLSVLYNDQQLMDAFDKRIWIQMHDNLDISMLLRKIVEFTLNDHCSITSLIYLQEMVEEEITDKKIALFLDDADIEDQQFWNSVLEVLNASARGSIVVMATKRATVAALTGVATHSYFLSPLSEENNLMLLQQYASMGTDIWSNPDLVVVAKRLISRFGANPLNLKAIGGLLRHTDITSLQKDTFEGSVIPLQLCHDVLPVHLKKCLAFCSLFPKGYIFDRHRIILLWISHGCVKPVEGCELEDVGSEYFNDLLCRSFFQNSPFHNDIDEKFVMHELIYKVVESVSHNRYFSSEDLMDSVLENILHLSLVSSQIQTVQLMPRTEKLKDLQTFLVLQLEGQQHNISVPTLNLVGLDDFFLKFTSLETLDLSHTDIQELPGSIVSIRNLQYLSITNTSIRALPSELCILSNLQTLNAKDCRFLTELPGDIRKLRKLRHLDVTKELGHVLLPHGIGHLTELQTLPVFHARGDSSLCCITELGSLHKLRGCLRLSGLNSIKTSSKAQKVNLKIKEHLKDITLQWHDGGADIDDDDDDEADNVAEQVLEGFQPHANLQELTIKGYEGSVFPSWMQSSSSLSNLVSLTLDSCCNCTQFPAIDQLPSLKFLSIQKMYYIQQLSSDINGGTKFPSLELLNLWEMYGLEELFEASEDDCPCLRKICISRCSDLKRLPSIPSVNELVLHCCHQLPDILELGSLASLKIEGFHGVKSFSLTPAALPVLKKLEIKSCNELSSVHGLEALTTVQRLKISGCPKLVLPTSSLAS